MYLLALRLKQINKIPNLIILILYKTLDIIFKIEVVSWQENTEKTFLQELLIHCCFTCQTEPIF